MTPRAAKKISVLFVLSAALALAGCGQQTPLAASKPVQFNPADFDGDHALFEVKSLVAVGPRDAMTPGAERASKHIVRRLAAFGVTAETDVFTSATRAGQRVFRNIIARFPGDSSNVVIVCSHYDTKSGIPNFQGAEDSGSSSGALLEMARMLAHREKRGPEVRLVWFDGEECVNTYSEIDGLHGSRHYAQKLADSREIRNVLGVILLDMIGDRDLSVTIANNNDRGLVAMALEAAHEENARTNFSLIPYEIGDDHVPFLEHRIPALDLIDFEFGSAPGRNDYWHTSQDTLDKLSPASLQTVGRVTIRIVNKLIAQVTARR